MLSTGQLIGVLLAVAGGVVISVHEELASCICGDKDKVDAEKEQNDDDFVEPLMSTRK